jgi:hypothetical protein
MARKGREKEKIRTEERKISRFYRKKLALSINHSEEGKNFEASFYKIINELNLSPNDGERDVTGINCTLGGNPLHIEAPIFQIF